MPSVLCVYCEPSDHDIHNCPYCDYVDAISLSLRKMINDMTHKMGQTIKERELLNFLTVSIRAGRIITCISLTLV